MNVIEFKINQLYEITELKNVVYNKMKNSAKKFESIGFVLRNNKGKYLMKLNKILEKDKTQILLAKKSHTDVINLFAMLDDNPKRIGIAHIPTLKSSQICNRHIPTNSEVKVVCELNHYFKKWEPKEIILDNKKNIAKYEHVVDVMKNLVS